MSIEKIGDKYYLSLTVVQGNGLRFNGTMEPARLIDQGSYFATAPFFTMQATTAVAQIRPQGSQLGCILPRRRRERSVTQYER